jgi:hypothetical protein
LYLLPSTGSTVRRFGGSSKDCSVLNFDALVSLAHEWREEAALLERRGMKREARMIQSLSADLEERLREWELEKLTLKQAAAELGLKYDTVQRKVASGELLNVGDKGAPRVRRCDISGARSSTPRLVTANGEPDLASEVLAGRE